MHQQRQSIPESTFNPKFRLSLRIQLTLWVMLIFTIIQWVITLIVWVFLSDTIYQDYSQFFSRHSALVSSQIRSELPNLSRSEITQIEIEQLSLIRFHDYHIEVFTLGAQQDVSRITEPANAVAEIDASHIQAAQQSPSPVILDNVTWSKTPDSFDPNHTVVTLHQVSARDQSPYYILQATDDKYAQDRVMQMGQTLLVMSLAAPFLSLIAGWFISRIAVSPILKVQEAVSNLNPESLADPLEINAESTEVIELVEQIDDSRDQLRIAFESQARFLSNVSHELKTPIAVMQVESETLNTDQASDEVKQFVRSVRDEMTRLGKMIESFLTLTRIQDGFGNLQGKPYAFNDLVMDSLDQCIAMASQNGVTLDPVLFSDEDTIDLCIRGDADLLITMLNNLVRNAIRYSPTGGVVKVHLKHVPIYIKDESGNTTLDEQTVQISVIDQGPGIPEDRLDSIFDRFAKVEDADRSGRGHGLGLAIAQGIAELHSGTIRVQNNSTTTPTAKGCTFMVTLPALVP